ncbi:MAG: polysaccharide deacetylase family protein [Candidatus Omnitrophica bacterium]|nr:polysaccharide deacetylase family protein [Candidatus Omnitrophota bacterium]
MRLRIAVFFLVCLYFPTFGRAEEMKLPEVESMGRGVTLLWEGPSDRQVVALTFDDGPIPGKTEPILDLLGENQVPATFFRPRRERGAPPGNPQKDGSRGT